MQNGQNLLGAKLAQLGKGTVMTSKTWSRKKFELGDLTKNSEPQKKHFFQIFHDAHFSNTPARITATRHLCRWLLQAAVRAQGQRCTALSSAVPKA